MAEETISIQVIDKYGDLRPTFVITRTEAIERMANVFYDFCEGCKTYEEYEHLAEAALDALIKKG